MSGVFSVTFLVIFAYVTDVTQEHEQDTAYGWGLSHLCSQPGQQPHHRSIPLRQLWRQPHCAGGHSGGFILLAVPEYFPEKMRPLSRGVQILWKEADPFVSLKKAGKDSTILVICISVFYLPETGQYSSSFFYLRQVIGFRSVKIVAFRYGRNSVYYGSDSLSYYLDEIIRE